MSELIFVRHGQASFGAASYDALSDLGFEQVRELARHWQTTGDSFDHICSGTLQRQRETAGELLHLVKGEPDAPEQHASLNEYSGDPLIRIYLRDHAKADGLELPEEWPIKDRKLFQSVLEAATPCWINDELEAQEADQEFEPWQEFKQRVHSVVDDIMSRHQQGSRVIVSTSGGVIATALQRVLDYPDDKVIATNWMVHNSSVTKIRYGGGRASMTQFNCLPHLERQGMQHLVTYR